MIVKEDMASRLPQFNKALQHLMRRNRTLDGQQCPVISKRRQQAHPAELALARGRRNRFFKRVAYAWTIRDASADASMAALATLLSPWTRWSGGTITLTSYQAWLIYFERIFQLWDLAIFDPVDIAAVNTPWPTDWPTPVDYDTVSIDFFVNPPRVTLHHVTPVPTSRGIQLLVYLAAPNKRFTNNPLSTSMLFWAIQANAVSPTTTVNKFDLPDYPGVYPYTLPIGSTPCAIRPVDGHASIGTPPKSTLLPYSNFVYRFSHPGPG